MKLIDLMEAHEENICQAIGVFIFGNWLGLLIVFVWRLR